MSIALMMKVEEALRRIDVLEKNNSSGASESERFLFARVEKLEGELKAMKARMGKRESADV